MVGHRVLAFLATAPLAIPGIVLGVGLFLAYTRPPLTLYGTLWILLIAFVTIELPAAYQQLGSAFHSVHPELEEAGRMLGATRLRTLKDITAPLLRSAAIATWCFIFVGVIRELSAAVILFTSETKVLSVLIFDLKESGDVGAIAVLSLTMIVLTTIVIVIANRIGGSVRLSRARRPRRRLIEWPWTGARRRSSRWRVVWDYMRLVHPPVRADAILTLGSFDVQAAVHAAALWKAGPRAGDRHVGRPRPSRRRARHRLEPARGARLRRGGDRRGRAREAILLEERGAEHRPTTSCSSRAVAERAGPRVRASCWSSPSPT